MQNVTSVQLTRDCAVTQIPSGALMTLPAGTAVDITQSLGGNYTLHALSGGLYRLAQQDADALGLAPEPAVGRVSEANGVVAEQAVWDALRTCYDPEIPVNIVDLGLVYDVSVERLPSGRSAVAVKMTLTAPGCGMGGLIAGDAQQKLCALDGVEAADVQIVWDPPWHPTLISEEGRRVLGLD